MILTNSFTRLSICHPLLSLVQHVFLISCVNLSFGRATANDISNLARVFLAVRAVNLYRNFWSHLTLTSMLEAHFRTLTLAIINSQLYAFILHVLLVSFGQDFCAIISMVPALCRVTYRGYVHSIYDAINMGVSAKSFANTFCLNQKFWNYMYMCS